MEQGAELFGTTYRRGDIVFRQGDPGDAMYIIQSGAVEVSQCKNGRESVIAILEKGDFFGEMALLQNDSRSATITAISLTRLIPLPKTLFIDRLKQDPDVSLHLLKKLIQRIQRAHRRYRQKMSENEGFRDAVASHSEKVWGSGRGGVPAEAAETLPEANRLMDDLFISSSRANGDPLRHHAAPGETIFREGEPGDAMYLIVSGSVGVSKGETHASRLIGTIGPGDFFGEMAIIADMPRSAAVTALEPTDLIVIDRKQFLASLENQPELAVAIIKTLIFRLSCLEHTLSDPDNLREQQRSPWVPRLKKRGRLSLSIVSLSTCAGCSAVMLDCATLSEILSMASINYCQMLMDQADLPESDVILVDGVVRLKEDERRLIEARRRCRHLVAWGTCAAFAGIPALANRFEAEAVIAESYGSTDDAFAYYFPGATGVDRSSTFQPKGIELQRRAFAVDSFVKVDTYLPGCPPTPSILLNWLRTFSGGQPFKTAPIVCAQCGRKPLKNNADTASSVNAATSENYCFNSLGRVCLGFMTRGGCDSVCPKKGVPCWGCRGPSKKTVTDIQAGYTLDEIATNGFRRRYTQHEGRFRAIIKRIKQGGHFMFDIDSEAPEKLLRMK
ncbi:cyclic nucleotide-binding domain-containing protein [Desulfosarcina sp.]|uniref:cyclic nucleotide-binding domain-containing protein n=1 Tax=Desulfosarcina sp. TaxID=2027861 RepID=UPI003563B0E2